MSVSDERSDRGFSAQAERTVLRWVGWYTRDLNAAVREDRLWELASDLSDHRTSSRARRRSDFGTGIAMAGRAIRGIPDDLAWRHTELRAEPGRSSIAERWTRSGTIATSYTVLSGVAAFALLAWVRILVTLISGDHLPSDVTVTSLLVGTTAMICGLAMLRRERLRWLAALWLGLATVLLLHFGWIALTTLSTTFYAVANHVSLSGSRPIVDPLVWLALIAVGVFFLALALAWAPLPTRSAKDRS